jgi:predicted transcriptional regulator
MARAPHKIGSKPRPADGQGKAGKADGDGLVLDLRGLRERLGKTQEEIARRTSITQSQLSRVETRRDHLMSTVRRYVRALGGEIEVSAIVDGTRIRLRDV